MTNIIISKTKENTETVELSSVKPFTMQALKTAVRAETRLALSLLAGHPIAEELRTMDENREIAKALPDMPNAMRQRVRVIVRADMSPEAMQTAWNAYADKLERLKGITLSGLEKAIKAANNPEDEAPKKPRHDWKAYAVAAFGLMSLDQQGQLPQGIYDALCEASAETKKAK